MSRRVGYLRWIAAFDMEDLTHAILACGLILATGLMAAALLLNHWGWSSLGPLTAVHAANPAHLLAAAVENLRVPGGDAQAIAELAIGVLLWTTYARLAASVFYFAAVERSWKYAACSGTALCVLTYMIVR